MIIIVLLNKNKIKFWIAKTNKWRNVQKQITKRLAGFKNLTYNERLKLLRLILFIYLFKKIRSLEHRRLKFDLILL